MEDLWKSAFPVGTEVVSPFPPSDKIGIKSAQRENEKIVPMKLLSPYIPMDCQVDGLNPQIFTLTCNQRMKIDRVKQFEYCLPYFYNPLVGDEQETVVQIIFPAKPKPVKLIRTNGKEVICEFDWEMDEREKFTQRLIYEGVLSEDQRDAFKEFVRERVREAKKANREAEEARRKILQEMSEETRRAYEEIKFYKFYPVETPDTPDISQFKVLFINQYYDKAHRLF